MGHDQNGPAPPARVQQVGHDPVLPIGDGAGHHVGQALGPGKGVHGNVPIARVAGRMVLVAGRRPAAAGSSSCVAMP